MGSTPGRSQGGGSDPLTDDVRAVVEAATWAPSVHNTQPWLFSRRGHRIIVRADADRRLSVTDPEGRGMLISCGAAIFTLRVAARHLGYEPRIALLPDPDRPHLLADVSLGERTPESEDNGRLHGEIRRRRTHRGAFKPDPVGESLLSVLRQEAQREGATLRVVVDVHTEAAVAALTAAAEHVHRLTPSYAGELARWAPAPGNPRREGVHESAYPKETPHTEPHFPGRDFARGHGWGAAAGEESGGWPDGPVTGVACILTTKGDEAQDWLRAGQALQRVLLRASVEADISAAFHTQALEIPELREFIRTRFCAGEHPQLVLRLGAAAGEFTTVRRPVEQVLHDEV
ncbi:Acg family FMN-binding oxidoreductase [Spirillospora sp. NPDC048911]|uniref:Acg family FMN-binding oxidoreductase n=1 Tax=Spirillospora sp. NPDC048911 TaxID=3364527 RepID=UPI00371665DE